MGRLSGPGVGWCGLGPPDAESVETGRVWWLFELDGTNGSYTCDAAGRVSPTLVVGGEGAPSLRVFGVYRCGARVEPIVPAIRAADGSEAFQRTVAIPCAGQYPGQPLPFVWNAVR